LDGSALIASAAGHALSLKEDGSVWAWGRYESGELGVDTTGLSYGFSSTPLKVLVGRGTQPTSQPSTDVTSTVNPTITATQPGISGTPVPGFGFGTMAMTGCVLTLVSLFFSFNRRKLL
jgi:hypothetical protein